MLAVVLDLCCWGRTFGHSVTRGTAELQKGCPTVEEPAVPEPGF